MATKASRTRCMFPTCSGGMMIPVFFKVCAGIQVRMVIPVNYETMIPVNDEVRMIIQCYLKSVQGYKQLI